MAFPSPDPATSFAASSIPATVSAGVVTAGNAAHGFRSPNSVMALLPHLFAKMASLGYIGTESDPLTSPIPASAEVFTTNATKAAVSSHVAGNATSSESPTVSFDGGMRSVGSVFAYVTSKWVVLCLFMTVLLNRTLIYASLRRPIRLPFKTRLLMRIVPVAMLAYQIFNMLLAMRCQTSKIFQGERTGGAAWGGGDFFFHAVGKAGSFWLDDRAVCESIGMIPDSDWIDRASSLEDPENPEIEILPPKGSLGILWPLYKTLSFSQFVETFTCSLISRVPSENGMTLLEHSLAFAEAEALATRKTYRLETAGEEGQEPKILKMKGEKLVPTQVLYISVMSSMSHITSHVMAIFNKQTRYRLLTTGFYGFAFLGGFAIALCFGGTAGILDFPTVSVVGFIPHLLILAGITVCAGIYGLALLLSSLFPPSGRMGFAEGFNNLCANLTLSSASVSLTEDFYQVLLKLGYICLTAAAEATYLNEGRAVRIPGWTWLEGEHARMLDSRLMNSGSLTSQFVPTEKGIGPFAQERKDFKDVVKNAKDKRRTTGGRWIGAGELLRGVGVVLGRWGVVGASCLFGCPPPAAPLPSRLSPPQSDEGDSDLYERFLSGSSLPETDESVDYTPSNLSSSSSSSSDDESDGESTRTRCRRQTTPLLDFARLAALLDPQIPEDRASARLLARHLTSSHVLTRRQYTSLQVSGAAEENALENILLSRRRREKAGGGWEGEGGGPLTLSRVQGLIARAQGSRF
ncbi:hypothetical protein BDD12DRAFT_875285 [Trichophaea hybrida]|nr:hypothetical protein BDD12DRAFT_875285 [Trichophaea hybrida]